MSKGVYVLRFHDTVHFLVDNSQKEKMGMSWVENVGLGPTTGALLGETTHVPIN